MAARFSAPVQTGPEAHSASCTTGTGSFPGVRCGRGVTLTPHPHSSAEVKNRVQLHLYSLPKGIRGLWKCETYLPNKLIQLMLRVTYQGVWDWRACSTYGGRDNICTDFWCENV